MNARDRHVHFIRNFLGRWLAAKLLRQLLLRAPELVHDFNHVHWDTDGARLVGDDGDVSVGDFIEDKTAENPSDVTSYSLLKEKLGDVLTSLTERERRILEMRFGLVDGYERTLEEIGKMYNVTRERIRQIEAKALRKLRHPTRVRHLQGFLDTEEEAA